MKYLTPEIAQLSKKLGNTRSKPLAKPGVSCGIFQDYMDTKVVYTEKMIKANKLKNKKG